MVQVDFGTHSWNQILEDNPFLIFGVLNVTPDSFSDGGLYLDAKEIDKQCLKLIEQGAEVIDVGAESTRPGSMEVFSGEEIKRLNPVFELMKKPRSSKVLFSIDTRHALTAQTAIDNGFQIINDVSGATFDPLMAKVMADTKCLVVIMHSRGTPQTMANLTQYKDLEKEVTIELKQRCDSVLDAGVDPSRIMIDPGIGFAKTPQQGLELLESLGRIKSNLGYPMLVGMSRKTITSYLLSGDPQKVPFEERDGISSELAARLKSDGIDAVRVHNVANTKQILQ